MNILPSREEDLHRAEELRELSLHPRLCLERVAQLDEELVHGSRVPHCRGVHVEQQGRELDQHGREGRARDIAHEEGDDRLQRVLITALRGGAW